MGRLIIARGSKRKTVPIGGNQPENLPLCQMGVPGMGRIRTGELHPDFHVTDRVKRAKNRL